MDKEIKTIQALTEDLFSLMEVSAKVDVSEDTENESFVVNIDAGEATGLLIGRKGETLAGIQLVLSTMLRQKLGEWKRIMVNIGDYREKEEDYLKTLAETTAQRVKETGEPQTLYNLKPNQRRIIHLFLSEDPEIETESQGEGNERYLFIKPKKA